MQLFIDTAEIEEIKSLNITGLIDGVTTNPSLIAKSGRNIISTIEEICNEVSGPVSAEVTAIDFDNMISFLWSLGRAALKIEGNETRPFLSILLTNVETNKFIY